MESNTIDLSIYSDSKCPDLDHLRQYHAGNLPAHEAWEIESHLQNCPLCTEALEGIPFIIAPEYLETIKKEKNHVVRKITNQHSSNTTYLVIAGVILLVSTLIWTIFKPEYKSTSSSQIVYPQKQIIDPPVATKDSLTETIKSTDIQKTDFPISQKPTFQINPKSTTGIPEIIPKDSAIEFSAESKNKPILTEANRIVNSSSAMPVKYIHELKTVNYNPIYEEIYQKKKLLLQNTPPNMENVGIDRSIRENTDTLFYKNLLSASLLDYKASRYQEAQLKFNQILKIYPDDQNALFYGGLCYFEQGLFEEASMNYSKVLSHDQSIFREEAEWNFAKTKFELKKYEDCKILLHKIIKQHSFYASQAQDLLNRMP